MKIKNKEEHYKFESDLLVIDFSLVDFSKSVVIKNETDYEIIINKKNTYCANEKRNGSNIIIIGNAYNNEDSFKYFKILLKDLEKLKKQGDFDKKKDFEVAEDGRVTEINNWKSEKIIFNLNRNSDKIDFFYKPILEKSIKIGLYFGNKKKRDIARFKLEIETKLKNIAEKLNNGKKIDWTNNFQFKYFIYYDFYLKNIFRSGDFLCKRQGGVYCLSPNFLEEAKKEIGEENLIKYFED